MKGVRELFLIGAILSIFACNVSNYTEELPGGYTLVHKGDEYNVIYGKRKIYPNVVECVYNDRYIYACQEPNKDLYTNLLASELLADYYIYNNYMKDSVSQKYGKSRSTILRDSIIFKIFKNRNISFENSIEDQEKGMAVADSIIAHNPYHQKIFAYKRIYWTIDVQTDTLIGPMTLKEFNDLRIEKKIELDFKG